MEAKMADPVGDSIDKLKAVMDKAAIDANKIAALTVDFQSKMNAANATKQAGNASAVH
jgi:hypothetical protein